MASAINIDELRRKARRRLPAVIFDYIEGGAEDETTLRRNRQVFEAISFRPRVLAGGKIEASMTVFGEKLALPLIIAPTGPRRGPGGSRFRAIDRLKPIA